MSAVMGGAFVTLLRVEIEDEVEGDGGGAGSDWEIRYKCRLDVSGLVIERAHTSRSQGRLPLENRLDVPGASSRSTRNGPCSVAKSA